MDKPVDDITISSLGINSKLTEKKVKSVSMLGSDEKLKWKQQEDALIITKPSSVPGWRVVGFRVEFRK